MPESGVGSLQLELTLSRALPTSVGSKEAFTDFVTGKLGQTSKPGPTRNSQRQKCMKKTHLLLRILAVISRYDNNNGPHLMTVMIFIMTQNKLY